MIADARLITARRAFEFGPDELRLTVLSIPQVREAIARIFAFQTAQVATPMPTFAPPMITVPPGLVFEIGVLNLPDSSPMPIRFLHIDGRRIVVDVAGPTSGAVAVFNALKETLANTRSPDGGPAIGQFKRTQDYSEISVKFGFSPDSLLAPGLRDLFNRMFSSPPGLDTPAGIVVPSLRFGIVSPTDDYVGSPQGNDQSRYAIDLRLGSLPSDNNYYSSAPLDTESHLKYLADLGTTLGSPATVESD